MIHRFTGRLIKLRSVTANWEFSRENFEHQYRIFTSLFLRFRIGGSLDSVLNLSSLFESIYEKRTVNFP